MYDYATIKLKIESSVKHHNPNTLYTTTNILLTYLQHMKCRIYKGYF